MEQNIMSKTTEAQLRASDKYKKANIMNVLLQVNRKTEVDIVNILEACPNKMGYIKKLIRQDNGLAHDTWTLKVNDEDEVRTYPLNSESEVDAVAEAKRIVSLFDGWMKGRIDRSGWCIIKNGDEDKPLFLFK